MLAYHSVSDLRQDALAVPPASFEYQMAWLYRHGYRSMTLADFASQTIDGRDRIVVITFDDGYADNHALAFPILKRYGFAATIFLVSDYVSTDHIFSWDASRTSGHSDHAAYRLLTWDHIHDMAAHGIEFGSHTCTHPRQLTALSADRCWEEITRSREDLEANLDRQVVSFCYPRGDVDADVIHMVERAGYVCAVVSPPRAGIPLCRYTLRRTGIYRHNTPLHFRLKTMPVVRRYRERLRWLLHT